MSEFIETGIDVMREVPRGSHFCSFYETKQDLLDTLVPYFKAGLQNNEFCLWVISSPGLITMEEAKAALEKIVPELDQHLSNGNIEIINGLDWYLEGNVFNLERVLSRWNVKLERALALGYNGMRVSGDTFWLTSKYWKDFCSYEKQVNDSITGLPISLLCTYLLANSGAAVILDVVQSHQFAITRRQGEWEVIETPELIQVKAEIKVNEELEQRIIKQTSELRVANEELMTEIIERKRTEEKLRQSKGLLAEASRLAHVGSWTWDLRTNTGSWSDELYRIFGLHPGEIDVSAEAFSFVHPEDLDMVMSSFNNAVKNKEPYSFYYRILRRDGDQRIVHSRGYIVSDDDGNPTRMFGATQDVTELKKGEDELRLAYQRLSYHVENTPLGVIEFDKDLFIKRWSKRAEEIFGWKASEALGKNVYDPDFPIIYKDDIPAVDKINEQLTKGIVNWNLSPNRNYTKDGKVIYCEWYNSVLRDEHENVITILSLVYNVTERKKAEEQKEFEQREKEALINTTDDMIWSVDRNLKLIAANKAFIRGIKTLTGVTVKAGDDVLMAGVAPGDMVAFWEEAYNRALSGETFKKDTFIPAFNKSAESWRETSFNPIYKDGVVAALACYSRDITERKFAEERVRQSEAHLVEAQRLAKLGSWDFDIKSDRLTWSEELYNVFGTDKETFIGTHSSFLYLVDEEDREFALRSSRHSQQTGEPFTIQYHITTPKGEKRVIQEHGYGQTDDDGKVVRLFGTAQDITESKKAEEELHRLNKELHSLSSHLQNIREEERIQISRDIHDDLGQQLTGLKMDVKWLNKKLGTENEIVKQKIMSMLDLINETLKSVRRISSDLRPSILDDFGLIAALEWHNREVEKRTEIKVDFSADMPEPAIHDAIATGIFRIYQELVTNVVRHANARVISSSLRLQGNNLILKVKDDGQGMDPAATGTKKTLGLIGIKERTFALGGKFHLKTEPEKGTEVQVSIPYENNMNKP